MTTTGGEGLARALRQAKAAGKEEYQVEWGFKDERFSIATLAFFHEFGNPRAGLPERPAFRVAIRRIEQMNADWRWQSPLTREGLAEFALAGLQVVRESYLNFHGTPLSAAQTARKAGTLGAGRQLVGSEGPKMIEHIHAWVNDERVDVSAD